MPYSSDQRPISSQTQTMTVHHNTLSIIHTPVIPNSYDFTLHTFLLRNTKHWELDQICMLYFNTMKARSEEDKLQKNIHKWWCDALRKQCRFGMTWSTFNLPLTCLIIMWLWKRTWRRPDAWRSEKGQSESHKTDHVSPQSQTIKTIFCTKDNKAFFLRLRCKKTKSWNC